MLLTYIYVQRRLKGLRLHLVSVNYYVIKPIAHCSAGLAWSDLCSSMLITIDSTIRTHASCEEQEVRRWQQQQQQKQQQQPAV